MAVHRPPCHSDQEHNVVSLIREEVEDDYLPDLTDWAPGEIVEVWGK